MPVPRTNDQWMSRKFRRMPLATNGMAVRGSPPIDSGVGLAKFGTFKRSALQAVKPMTPAATMTPLLSMRFIEYVPLEVGRLMSSWSEPKVDAEEEASARRIGREVDKPHDVLVPEVVDFGIDAPIVRPHRQIATAEHEPRITAPAGNALHVPIRQRVRQRDLTKLHEAAVADVHAGVLPVVPLRIPPFTERNVRIR